MTVSVTRYSAYIKIWEQYKSCVQLCPQNFSVHAAFFDGCKPFYFKLSVLAKLNKN